MTQSCRPARPAGTGTRRQGTQRIPRTARHAGVLGRPIIALPQGGIRLGQTTGFYCQRLALGAGYQGSTGHGLERVCHIGDGYRGWKDSGLIPKKSSQDVDSTAALGLAPYWSSHGTTDSHTRLLRRLRDYVRGASGWAHPRPTLVAAYTYGAASLRSSCSRCR